MKDNLSLILDRVTEYNEVTLKLDKDVKEVLFRRIEKRANKLGISAFVWRNEILFRKQITQNL